MWNLRKHDSDITNEQNRWWIFFSIGSKIFAKIVIATTVIALDNCTGMVKVRRLFLRIYERKKNCVHLHLYFISKNFMKVSSSTQSSQIPQIHALNRTHHAFFHTHTLHIASINLYTFVPIFDYTIILSTQYLLLFCW